MSVITLEQALRTSVKSLNDYNPASWQSLNPCYGITREGRAVCQLELENGFFSYLKNAIKWYLWANDYKTGLKSLEQDSPLYKRLVEHADTGRIPYIMQGELSIRLLTAGHADNVSSQRTERPLSSRQPAHLTMDPNTPDKFPRMVNIGVIGERNTGKGRLINALRELKPKEESAAPVGPLTEEQEQTNRYPLKDSQVLCELPGASTSKWPLDNFAERTKLYGYDMLVITTGDNSYGLTKDSITLAKLAEQHKIPYVIVRTKVDNDIHDRQYDSTRLFKPEDILQELKNNVTIQHPSYKSGIF